MLEYFAWCSFVLTLVVEKGHKSNNVMWDDDKEITLIPCNFCSYIKHIKTQTYTLKSKHTYFFMYCIKKNLNGRNKLVFIVFNSY